jgi:hypothetical protein
VEARCRSDKPVDMVPEKEHKQCLGAGLGPSAHVVVSKGGSLW